MYGEIVIRSGCTFSFDDLLKRIHPPKAAEQLSNTDPVQVIVPVTDGRSLVELTFEERRARLEDVFVKNLAADPILQLSLSSERQSPCQSANRDGMVKIKNLRRTD